VDSKLIEGFLKWGAKKKLDSLKKEKNMGL